MRFVKKVWSRLWCGALLALALTACQKDPVKLTIISTNDFHGQIESSNHSDLGSRTIGGFEWLLGYFKAVREENPQGTILLDGGDLWQGTILSNMTQGQAVIALYNIAGYDAVAIGNHEFDFGPGAKGGSDLRYVLKERLREAKFPMLGANVVRVEDRQPLDMPNFKPYTIIERQGVKVAVIGLATPSTAQTTAPKHIYDLEFTDGASAVHRFAAEARAQGAQVVILLAHSGAQWDPATQQWQGEAVDLLKQIGDEVDLVIGAHTHTIISQTINGVPLMSAGYYGRSFVRADIYVSGRNGERPQVRLDGPTFFFHQTTSDAPPTYHGRVIQADHSFDDQFKEFAHQIEVLKNTPYGLSLADFTTEGQYESLVGHLVCDAMLDAASDAVVSLANRGSLRSNLPAGQVTFGHIYRVMPFDNEAVLVKLSGEQLLRSLEQGFDNEHGTLEIGGVTVYAKASAPSGHRITKAVLRDGREIVPDQIYTVVTNDFLYARGDGFSAISEGEKQNTDLKVRDILANYVKKYSPLKPAAADRYIVEK